MPATWSKPEAEVDAFTSNNGYLTSEVDGSVSNEGSLTVVAGGTNTSEIQSNTSGSSNVIIAGGTDISVTESGNTITIASTGRSFGELYGATTLTVNTSFITGTGFTAGAKSSDITLATDGITVTTDGYYSINYSASFSTSTNNVIIASSVFKGTTELTNIGWLRKTATGSDVGSAASSGFVYLVSGDKITFKFKTLGNSTTINFQKINASIHKVD